MIKLCLLLHGSKFVRFSRVVVACCHVWQRQATTAWSLISSGWFSLSRRFYHHPSLGCLRPLLVQHYPWPFEPRIFMVRFLSFMYKIFSDISFMCRTFTEIQSRRSISVLLLEQVRTWVGRRLGWGGDTNSGALVPITLLPFHLCLNFSFFERSDQQEFMLKNSP